MIVTQLNANDYQDYLLIVGDPTVGEFDEEFPKSEDAAREDFNQSICGYSPLSDPKGWKEHGIRNLEGTLIGLTSYRLMYESGLSVIKARVGIHLHKPWRGKGYASHALAALLILLKESTGTNVIEAVIDQDNHSSRRLFERAGFKKIVLIGGDDWFCLEKF
jgi:RimJ/RimL family protein N-acetyltransferase